MTEKNDVVLVDGVAKMKEVDISNNKIKGAYESENIQILEGLDAVKKRPGMYIGDVGETGLHHCLWEIIDNCVDEHAAGYCSKISVQLLDGNKVAVEDNGRGIPVGIHPQKKISAATIAVTVLHAGGKFGGEGSSYVKTGGLHGVGASVVNALSSEFTMRIKREGKVWLQEFVDGANQKDVLKPIADMAEQEENGTLISFVPDANVFQDVSDDGVSVIHYQFDRKRIMARLELLSYLCPGLEIDFIDSRNGERFEQKWKSNNFLDFLPFISNGKKMEAPVIDGLTFEKEILPNNKSASIYIRVAMQPHMGSDTAILSFVNNIYTPEGGTHMTGFRGAMTRTINSYAMENDFIKENLSQDDILEGLCAAILVRVEEPKFEGQTKGKLTTREAQAAVSQATASFLSKFLEENPIDAKAWVLRAVRARAARQAADKAREQFNLEKGNQTFRMPEKLADCSEKNPVYNELYFVEGDSAGGTAKQGRDRKTQAILPLRGKVINSQKESSDNVLKNQEVQSIITTLGCGYGDEVNIDKLRYHKVILMTDADVDGAHITTLLLTFFHNYVPELIKGGYVYVAMPPLYRLKNIRNPKNSVYLLDDSALEKFMQTNDPKNWDKQRFKGLGEMDADQLWDTTMNPENRVLAKVGYENGDKDSENLVFEMLMGESVPPRRKFIEENAGYVEVFV